MQLHYKQHQPLLITTLASAEKSSSAIGVLGIMIGVGPVLGPSLGGLYYH